ncbi:MAG: hypothetical protein ACSLEX_01920 [Minisyncoccota bacterium]
MSLCHRQLKIHTSSASQRLAQNRLIGSVHMYVVLLGLTVFVSGGYYLFAVNQTAVQGYHLRALEKELTALKQQNSELKISEADLRSLYRIEASEEALNMQKPETTVYLDLRGPVALK